jgi:hypothetical protein
MLAPSLFQLFKSTTENHWASSQYQLKAVYGYQPQPNSTWLPGLTTQQIHEFELQVQATFPNDFKCYLSHLNGIDLPEINVYGFSGEPHVRRTQAYSYPRDMTLIKEMMSYISEDYDEIIEELTEQGSLPVGSAVKFIPLYGHRYLACTPNLNESNIYSIVGSDAILFANSIEDYMQMFITNLK